MMFNGKKAMAGHTPEDIANMPRYKGAHELAEELAEGPTEELEERQLEQEKQQTDLEKAELEQAKEQTKEEEKQTEDEEKKSKKGGSKKGKAKAIAGGVLGFALGRNKPGQAAGELVSSSIFLAIAVDIIAAVTFSTGGNPLFALVAHILLLIQFRNRLGADKLLTLAFILNLLPIILASSRLTGGYDLLQFKLLMLTVGNGLFPVWTIFAGFFRNPEHNKFQKLVFWFFLLGSLGWALNTGIALDSYEEVKASSPEQVAAFVGLWTGLGKGVISIGKGALDTALAIPDTLGKGLNTQIGIAGGDELFGEPKERPKLGIEIQNHPYGFKEVGDKKIAKAILLVPNLPDENFLEISDVTCSADDDTVQPNELKTRLDRGEKIKIFYNNPMTVTCTFTEDNNNFEDISSITLTVKYDFKENAKLITYLMRDDLKTELLSRGEKPLDFMAVPSNKRNPTTVYDNGPAKIGIGPVELTTPPFGIGPNLNYSAFELVIGNKPDFGGEISNINDISITLPDGINLITESCIVARTDDSNPYTLSQDFVAEHGDELKDIESSRFFTCEFDITNEVLGAASFAEVEFDVTIDFTYETDKKIRLTKNT